MIEYKSSKNIILKHTNAVSSGTGSKLIPDTFSSHKIPGVNNTDNDDLIGAAILSVIKATEIDTSSGGAVRCTYVEIDNQTGLANRIELFRSGGLLSQTEL